MTWGWDWNPQFLVSGFLGPIYETNVRGQVVFVYRPGCNTLGFLNGPAGLKIRMDGKSIKYDQIKFEKIFADAKLPPPSNISNSHYLFLAMLRSRVSFLGGPVSENVTPNYRGGKCDSELFIFTPTWGRFPF